MKASLAFAFLFLVNGCSSGVLYEKSLIEQKLKPVDTELINGSHFPEKPKNKSSLGPAILNGDPLYKSDWPASYMFHSNFERCTATQLSARVILVAAHCGSYDQFDNLGGVTWPAEITSEGEKVEMLCTNHTDVKFQYLTKSNGLIEVEDVRSDFALCKLEKKHELKIYEGIFSGELSNGRSIFLHGYGCTTDAQLNEKIMREYGTLLGGYAKIEKQFLDRFLSKGKAHICPGDSGGGAFIVFNNEEEQSRALIGVNSIIETDGSTKVSKIADVTKPLFTDWAQKWAQENTVEICGLTSNAKNCRYD